MTLIDVKLSPAKISLDKLKLTLTLKLMLKLNSCAKDKVNVHLSKIELRSTLISDKLEQAELC